MLLEKSFLRICLSFTFYLSTILALAVFGYFTTLFVAFVTILFVIVSLYFVFTCATRPNKEKPRKIAVISFLVITIFSLFVGYFHHDLPTGRDDFSYIYAADRLSQSGSLEWEDYFSRPVHGVRNLGGDTFTSQFLPTYISYLAVYNMFGGLEALMWANVLLVLLTFGVIYYLVRLLADKKASLIALILLLSSYVFFWFPKRTNVENISIFLIWLGVWLAVLSIKKEKPIYLIGGLIPFSLLSLTRPEGLIFFAVYFVVAIYLIFSRYKKTIFNKEFLNLAGLIVVALNIAIFYFYIVFYKAGYILTQAIDVLEGFDFIYKNVSVLLLFVLVLSIIAIAFVRLRKKVNFQQLLFWAIIGGIITFEIIFFVRVNAGDLTWIIYRTQYVLENFVFYFYFIYIFIILLGLRKKLFSQKEFLVALLLLPAFFFIIEPNIALDQPWFMRRFFPTLIPLFVILSAVVLVKLNIPRGKLKYIVFSLVMIGIITTRSIFIFVEHDGLKDQVEEFNEIFTEGALVVMKPGWGWQKIALMQHYFYDVDALPNIDLYRPEEFKKVLPNLLMQYPNWEKSDDDLLAVMNWQMDKAEQYFVELLSSYSDIYVVTDEETSHFFRGFDDQNLEFVNDFTFTYKELNKESNLTGYIQQTEIIDMKKVRNLQNSIPPSLINTEEIELFVYKVKDIQAYVPFEYVIEITEDLDPGYYYSALKQVDLLDYKKDLQGIVRDIELGLD